MAGLESAQTQGEAGEGRHAGDGMHAFEAGADYRIPHGDTTEVRESGEQELESSDYARTAFKGGELRVFRARHEGEFTDVHSRPYRVERFGSPDDVVRGVNPFYGDGSRSYDVNCADCARSVERTWRGDHEEAAGRLPRFDPTGAVVPHGESSAVTEEWAGERFTPAPNDVELRRVLTDGGHGSSAIVHSTWEQDGRQMAGGHAYNVVNFRGALRVLDGQSSENFDWMPGDIHPAIGRNPEHRVMAWNAKGERIW